MNGIVLLDDEQLRNLKPQQQQPEPKRGREEEHKLASNRIQSENRHCPPARSPPPAVPPSGARTGYSTQASSTKPILNASRDRSIEERGHTDTQRTSSLASDSYPILRDDQGSFRDNDRAAADYAGTSSGHRVSVRLVLFGVVLGLALGIMCSELEVSSLAAQWINLPGELFLRALNALVVPYVFCSVAVAIGDIVFVGKVSVVGRQTATIFFVFWLATAALGVSVALIFRPFFRKNPVEEETTNSFFLPFSFTCANNLSLSMGSTGRLVCDAASSEPGSTEFILDDVSHLLTTFVDPSKPGVFINEHIMQMITDLVSMNIVASLAFSELLSVITFAMVLGTIAGRNYFSKTRRTNYLYLILLQLRNTFFLMIEWTSWFTPLAVTSFIAGSFATNLVSLRDFGFAAIYPVAALAASLLQIVIVYPLIVFMMTRCNPYTHMMEMVRAYAFAFACSSSLATAPITLTCVRKARMCSQSLANFVISIGVSSNVSGMGIYTPVAVIFIAESSGNGDQITWIRVLGLFILSLLLCFGTPPIPGSGRSVIYTTYFTLFGDIPSTISYIEAADFILDRICAICNVNDDVMALKIIAENTDETVAQDHLGQRF